MRRGFVEVGTFVRCVEDYGPELLSEIQSELLRNLESGKLVQGTGGLQKLRISDTHRGKGKRGGYRVIYLDIPHVGLTYLVALYSKDRKDDLSPYEKKSMKHIVERIRAEFKKHA